MHAIDMIVREWQSGAGEETQGRPKRPTSLDLGTEGTGDSINRAKRLKSELAVTVLPSPEFERLVLSSPEFEHFLKGALGVNSTEQSAPLTSPKIFSSQAATEEQRLFVKGFEDALEQCKRRHIRELEHAQPSGSNETSMSTTTSTLTMLTSVATSESVTAHQIGPAASVQLPTDKPNPVTSFSRPEPTMPVLAMDSDDLAPAAETGQNDVLEESKLERKRLRNRLAASKCRKKKLERIAQLEHEVHTLKIEKNEYLSKINTLSNEITHLRQELAILQQHQQQRYMEL